MSTRWLGRQLVAAWLFAAGACDNAPPPREDAGADAGADAGPGPVTIDVAPPAAPAPAVLTPCPTGYTARARAGGIVVCEPFAGGSPDACADGFVQLPGEPACRRFGTDCPADGVPTGLPAGASVLHVRAGATAGDGSVVSPFGTVTEALAVATDGTIVAIAPGTYDEALRLERAVTLWGACPASVLLTSSVADTPVRAGVVTIASTGATVRNLAIGESARPGVWAAGATAAVDLVDVVVRGADRVGVEAESGAHVTAHGLVVRDTKPGPTGQFGRGLGVQSGSLVEVHGALFERNHEMSAVSLNPGSMLVLEDAVLRDGLPRVSNGRDGLAVLVNRGGSARLARIFASGNTSGGVSAIDPGSNVEIVDAVIRDSRPQMSDGAFGRGLNVEGGASMTARRVLVEQSHEIGVMADGAGTTLRLEDAIIVGTLPRDVDGLAGRGLDVQRGAVAEAYRVVLEDNTEAGILAGQGGATLTIDDAVVRRTLPGIDGVGRGLAVQDASVVVASRLQIEDSSGVAVVVTGAGADLTLTDTRLSRTLALTGAVPARGVALQAGAIARLSRIVVEDTAQYGLTAMNVGTTLELTDVLVADTTATACTAAGCLAGGTAIGTFMDGAATATRFVVRRADQCGVQLADRGSLDLHEGDISECAIGACLQIEGYDVGRLSDAVRYHDNGRSLDTTILPVPEALPGLAVE